MKNLNMRGDNNNKIMEFQGHGGIKHFGNSEGEGGIKGGWKLSMVWYGYFLESPIVNFSLWLISQGSEHYNYNQSNYYQMTITSQLVNNIKKVMSQK